MDQYEINRKHKNRTHVRFKDHDYDEVLKAANNLGVTIPELIRGLLKDYLNVESFQLAVSSNE